ncbi:unnamed protein product [Caenorhabditis sp. 36 PRJEB53466]|nr:unnamed protein product [Caenorhabditis sp. 36 PRJEB53466]
MFLDECRSEFETDCLYKVLGVEKNCDEKALKKGYYRQSMRWHPDKSNLKEEEKAEYTTKFQLLNKAYQILSDDERRKIYDETGSVDDEAGELKADVLKAWRSMFRKVTKEDIDNFMEQFEGSEQQKQDLIAAYKKHDGDIRKIQETVIGYGDIEKLKGTLDALIDEGIIGNTKKYEATTSEKKIKAYKRKAEKEAAEVENSTDSHSDLVALIQGRQQERNSSFLDALAAKYAPSSSKKAKRQ